MNTEATPQQPIKCTELASRVILFKERLERAIASGTGSRECNAVCDELITDLGMFLTDLPKSSLDSDELDFASRQTIVVVMFIGRAGWRRRTFRADLLTSATVTLDSLRTGLLAAAIKDLDPAARAILEVMTNEVSTRAWVKSLINGTGAPTQLSLAEGQPTTNEEQVS